MEENDDDGRVITVPTALFSASSFADVDIFVELDMIVFLVSEDSLGAATMLLIFWFLDETNKSVPNLRCFKYPI